MQCPFCGQDDDKVVDSRSSEGGRAIRRRRQCLACSRRYTTYERPEGIIRLAVAKKDGSRVPYEREKIISGLQKACYKRPVSDEQIRRIVDYKDEFGVTSIEAETDRGTVTFQVRTRDDVRVLSPTRALFRDADGNTYELADLSALDQSSQKYLQDYF